MRIRAGVVLIAALLMALGAALPAQGRTITVKNAPDVDDGFRDDARFVGWGFPIEPRNDVYDTLGRGLLPLSDYSSCTEVVDVHEGEALFTRAPRTFPFVPGVSDNCNQLWVKDLDSETEARRVYQPPEDDAEGSGYGWLADDWLVGEFTERYPGAAPSDPIRAGIRVRNFRTGEERTYVYEQRHGVRVLDVDDNRVLFALPKRIDDPDRTIHVDLDANRATELPPATRQIFVGMDGAHVLGYKGSRLTLFPAPGVAGARTIRVARGSYDGGAAVNAGVVSWFDYVGSGRRQRARLKTRAVDGGRTRVIASRRRGRRPFAPGDQQLTLATRHGVIWQLFDSAGNGRMKFTFPRR